MKQNGCDVQGESQEECLQDEKREATRWSLAAGSVRDSLAQSVGKANRKT